MTNLQPKQFWYHSSKRNLTPGVDQILPANDERVGGSHYGYSKHDDWRAGGWDEPDGSSRGDFTFAADTEEEAEAWLPSERGGRPVTYVVDAQSQPYHDFEDQHHMTNYGEGVHIKVPGPMPIVDRIDIPRPNGPNEVVQGTLPPQNWGEFNALPEGYTGPATMGEQHPESDNFKRIFPAYEELQRETTESNLDKTRGILRQMQEQRWKRAGQQNIWGTP